MRQEQSTAIIEYVRYRVLEDRAADFEAAYRAAVARSVPEVKGRPMIASKHALQRSTAAPNSALGSDSG